MSNQNRALHLDSSEYVTIEQRRVFQLTCSYIDFDGHRFGANSIFRFIPGFTGVTPIVSLQAFPLKLHGDEQNIRSQLIERGRRFEELDGPHYCHFDGVAEYNNSNGCPEYFILNGRVVIDELGYNHFSPNKATHLSTSNSLDPADWTQNLRIPMRAKDEDEASGMTVYGMGGGIPEHGRTRSGDDQRRTKLTEDQTIICGPFIHGYAVDEKKWLTLCIDSLSPISFDRLAFSDLRLPEQHKALILGLTAPENSERDNSKHLIEADGYGVLIHLFGPHAVGKTLTAESLSEKLRVPLITLTSGDSALEPYSQYIESRLRRLISMCNRWSAIILLDEADAMLQETDRHNVDQQRLVSIFLRVSEQYKGIMFLTTNHLEKPDAVFETRIHISLKYPELDRECRRGIWETFLRRHNVAQDAARQKRGSTVEQLHQNLTPPHQVSDGEIRKLAEVKLDGREIKDFIVAAQRIAVGQGEALNYGHIDTFVSSMQNTLKAKEANDEACRRIYG